MNRIAVAATFAAASLLVTVGSASACAMYHRPVAKVEMVAGNQLEAAQRAEARGEVRAALRLYERFMNGKGEAGDRAHAALRAAVLRAKIGHDAQSRARLNRATALAPRDGGVALAAARLHRDAGRAGQAREAYDRALALGIGEAGEVHAELALLLARDGDTGGAQAHLQSARLSGASPDAVIAVEAALGGGVAQLRL